MALNCIGSLINPLVLSVTWCFHISSKIQFLHNKAKDPKPHLCSRVLNGDQKNETAVKSIGNEHPSSYGE